MKSDVDVEHLLEDDHTLSPPTSCTSSSSSSYYHTSIHALSSQPSSSYSSLNLASWSATQSDHQISRITPARRVNELKDEVKYMLERQRLIRRDVYEYDAHSRSGIDLRYDLITICRTFLGDDNISPYLTPYESVSHQLEMLKFPQRDIIDKGAVQSYLQSIMKIKRALSHSEEFPPVEIVIKADPQDVLVGESHAMVMANISFNIPTKVHSEPFHCYRYDVMFNLRILSQPAAPLGQMSYLQDDIQSPNYSMASLDDGRRKRDHSELRASQIPSSEDESMTPYEVAPQTMDPLPFDSNPAFPFPNSQSIGSTNIPYQSGKSHLSMDCSVDILHLYSATLKEVKARFHSRSRTHRSLSSL